ncbi:hypothetical protein XELAEV_18026901mg [Xenopus laevis]|uniref:Uncharacterized protein n=1 Tax=Xenopus laevis TaxID=8355 RepID=A0A974CX45_XENLA|nr:hypothetical protein XELAEV_18026901mg [Xenopus laevis]
MEIYADLSPVTLQKCKAFTEITKALRQHGIQYRWGHPVKLIVLQNGTPTTLATVTESLKALTRCDILTPTDTAIQRSLKPTSSSPRKIQKEWHKV